MANAHRGEHTLELGGVTYTVRLTYNAVAEAEQAGYFGTDASAIDVVGRMATGHLFLRDLRALFWAGAKGQGDIETVEDAGEVLGSEPGKFGEIGNVLGQALADLFPQAEDPDDAEGN